MALCIQTEYSYIRAMLQEHWDGGEDRLQITLGEGWVL